MLQIQSFWTYQLTSGNTIVIDESFSLTQVSVLLTSGNGTVSGTNIAGGLPSQNLALSIGNPITFGGSGTLLITGLTIASSGNIYIIGR